MSKPVGPVVVSVQSCERHAFSKPVRNEIRLIENWGVEGDSHAGTTDQHLFHIKKFGLHRNLRQVHLIHAELFDDLNGKGHMVRFGQLGENIATRDIDLLGLPTGARLCLGTDAVIEITGLRNPCIQVEGFQKGLLTHLVEKTPRGITRKGGVMAIVLKGGVVRTGAHIELKLPPLPHLPLTYRTPELDAASTDRKAVSL